MGIMDKFKVEKPKEFQLTSEELSEYSFYAMQIRAREMELRSWSDRLTEMRARIKQRCGIKDTEKEAMLVDWDNVFSTSKIYVSKRPQIHVTPEGKVETKQEIEQNAKLELSEKPK
jgi:hypothetical protein